MPTLYHNYGLAEFEGKLNSTLSGSTETDISASFFEEIVNDELQVRATPRIPLAVAVVGLVW